MFVVTEKRALPKTEDAYRVNWIGPGQTERHQNLRNRLGSAHSAVGSLFLQSRETSAATENEE
jgi:hypothetical protein